MACCRTVRDTVLIMPIGQQHLAPFLLKTQKSRQSWNSARTEVRNNASAFKEPKRKAPLSAGLLSQLLNSTEAVKSIKANPQTYCDLSPSHANCYLVVTDRSRRPSKFWGGVKMITDTQIFPNFTP